jgi:hypothetical protein
MHDRMNTKGRFSGPPLRSTPALPDAMYGAVQRHLDMIFRDHFGDTNLRTLVKFVPWVHFNICVLWTH